MQAVRRDTVNYTLVGAVVLAAIVLLLIGLALITGRSGATTGYVVHYRNVTGLRYGAPIFYQGYRIGQVGGVTPERTAEGTRYKVELDIRRDWPIPKDSPARLQSTGLLADVSVGISEGASKDMLAPGGELKGVEGADIFAAMNELAGQISELTRNQITPLIRTLTARVDSITGTSDEKTPVILEQTRVLLDRLNVASASLNDVLNPENRAEIAKTLTEVSRLSTELRKTRETLDQALGEVAAIAKERGVPRAQVALAWMLSKPHITAPIVGASKPNHLEDAVAALDLKLTPEEIERLESPYLPHSVAGFS